MTQLVGTIRFFVRRCKRGQGYGRNLLSYAVEDTKRSGASSIIIQPGLFELDDNGRVVTLSKDEYRNRLEKLLRL